MLSLYDAYEKMDASLVEINPFLLTKDNRLIALDAKVNFDDNAMFRHKDYAELRDLNEEEPLEIEASKYDLNYIKLDGNIGCMVNGAGLAMATMDIIKLAGGEPANFLDVGGGASQERVEQAFKILLADENVKAVLINIFGGIVRCDMVANGVVAAAKNLGVSIPIVARLEGTNVEEGRRVLARIGHRHHHRRRHERRRGKGRLGRCLGGADFEQEETERTEKRVVGTQTKLSLLPPFPPVNPVPRIYWLLMKTQRLMTILSQVSRFGLAALFLFAVGAKLYFINDPQTSFVRNLPSLVGERWVWPVAIAVIGGEALAAVLLLIGKTKRWGAGLAATMLVVFAGYALYYQYGWGMWKGWSAGALAGSSPANWGSRQLCGICCC